VTMHTACGGELGAGATLGILNLQRRSFEQNKERLL